MNRISTRRVLATAAMVVALGGTASVPAFAATKTTTPAVKTATKAKKAKKTVKKAAKKITNATDTTVAKK